MRSFNKHILNHLTRWFARWPRGPFAVIRHTGRRNGKPYETPIMVERTGNRFVVALTYGTEVDWYRNLQTAGGAKLLWHGNVYTVEKPEPLPVQKALPLYSPLERLILRRWGTQDFVSLRYQEDIRASDIAHAYQG